MIRRLACGVVLLVAVSGCSTFREIFGIASPGDPSITLRSAEPRWLLIRNPRFGDVPSEPEYIWVEEDKVPFTLKGLFNRDAIVAAPEVVAKYGQPPGGGRISPRQGMVYQTAAAPSAEPVGAPSAAARNSASAATAARPAAPAAPEPRRGYVVYVDTTRIVIDLTAVDGIGPGSVVSVRRDKIPIVHPVTGELLGELDEEVGTARVTDVRERFSVADIQQTAPGAQIRLKDRVLPK
jgi:hypothetical protein